MRYWRGSQPRPALTWGLKQPFRQTVIPCRASSCGQRLRRHQLQCCASLTTGSEGVPTNAGFIPARRQRSNWPDFFLSREEAVQVQLQALRRNNEPHKDFGVEVLYRFADIDLLSEPTLSRYFGRRTDLGRFELFCWEFREPPFSLLVDHRDCAVTSSLQLSDTRWAQRLVVTGASGRRGAFEFTMAQRCGGRKDGFWFTESLLHDANADLEFMA